MRTVIVQAEFPDALAEITFVPGGMPIVSSYLDSVPPRSMNRRTFNDSFIHWKIAFDAIQADSRPMVTSVEKGMYCF
jgi:hypothetical protein